jgi:hypothetical protein
MPAVILERCRCCSLWAVAHDVAHFATVEAHLHRRGI